MLKDDFYKKVKHGQTAKEAMLEGIEKLYQSVAITLGPKGRNVIMERHFGLPHVTKDGVTVAAEMDLEDKFENLGASIIKDAAIKTGEHAGDGTTSAVILAREMIIEGHKLITAGENPIDIKREIDQAIDVAIEKLDHISQDIKNNDEIKSVATISANNDQDMGDLIAEGMSKIGTNGMMTVEESKGIDTYVEVVDGMKLDKGLISPYFVTNPDKMECVMDNPAIFLYDNKIEHMQDVVPMLEASMKAKKPLIIIAENVEGQALSALIVNKMNGKLKVCAIPSPGYGVNKMEQLDDIAAITGATVVSQDRNKTVLNTSLDDLGTAHKVIINKDSTTIINGGGDAKVVEERIQTLKKQMDSAESSIAKEQLKQRIANMTGGVSILHIGAASDIELKEKMDRADDAIRATAAAKEEGIVSGGGMTYLQLAKEIDSKLLTKGANIVVTALKSPIRMIAHNAGKKPDVIENEAWHSNLGYDAKNDKSGDLKSLGVLDPAKVIRVAMQNAASVAGMFLLSDCAITNVRKESSDK